MMAEFVLIHGSGQSARCWTRVGALLTARGHDVVAPDLPKQVLDWGITDYAAEIARSVTGTSTVVVAHSFSGVFLPVVAQARECGLLVFLAAVIPEPGKSVREQFAADAGMFSHDWIEAGPRWFDAAQKLRLAAEFLFHDCDPATLDWGRRTSRRVLGAEALEIQAGHCPHVSRPDEVARMLEQLAAERVPEAS